MKILFAGKNAILTQIRPHELRDVNWMQPPKCSLMILTLLMSFGHPSFEWDNVWYRFVKAHRRNRPSVRHIQLIFAFEMHPWISFEFGERDKSPNSHQITVLCTIYCEPNWKMTIDFSQKKGSNHCTSKYSNEHTMDLGMILCQFSTPFKFAIFYRFNDFNLDAYSMCFNFHAFSIFHYFKMNPGFILSTFPSLIRQWTINHADFATESRAHSNRFLKHFSIFKHKFQFNLFYSEWSAFIAPIEFYQYFDGGAYRN